MPAAQTQLTAAGLPGIFTRFPFNPNPTKAELGNTIATKVYNKMNYAGLKQSA
ncbi:hypothetical protein PORCAN_665 [Porphyromonas crevioricanis JCM 13913]|nr:hypothetical protein PORCAN_665 [Porphyromonas crevioricanis JCM 13913]